MTHEQLKSDLAAYARGVLEASSEAAVRAHLAAGCRSCLAEIFERPVGLPREERRTEQPAHGTPSRTARWVVGTLAAMVVVVSGIVALDARRRVVEPPVVTAMSPAPPIAAVGDRDRLRFRVASLKGVTRDLRVTTDDVLAERNALRQDVHVLERDVDALARRAHSAERRAYGLLVQSRRDDEHVTRLRRALSDSRALADAASAKHTRFVQLRPTRRFRDVRGHLVWDVDRDRAFVYVFGLPPSDGASGFVLRLTTWHGVTQSLGDLRPTHERAAGIRVTLPSTVGCGGRLEVVEAADNRVLLGARLDPCDVLEPHA